MDFDDWMREVNRIAALLDRDDVPAGDEWFGAYFANGMTPAEAWEQEVTTVGLVAVGEAACEVA